MKKILVVDDEKTIIEIFLIFLEILGYDASSASGGEEALEIFRCDPSAFDIVITDLSMPKMSGIELSEEIFKIRSDIPIIWCTGGYVDKIPAYVRGILFKPASMSEMQEIIESI